jgi:hypothetical protein
MLMHLSTDPKPSPAELMATPDSMLAWLRILPKDHVVAGDMYDTTSCLGVRFLTAWGHQVQIGFEVGVWTHDGWSECFLIGEVLSRALHALAEDQDRLDRPPTADQARRAILKARRTMR